MSAWPFRWLLFTLPLYSFCSEDDVIEERIETGTWVNEVPIWFDRSDRIGHHRISRVINRDLLHTIWNGQHPDVVSIRHQRALKQLVQEVQRDVESDHWHPELQHVHCEVGAYELASHLQKSDWSQQFQNCLRWPEWEHQTVSVAHVCTIAKHFECCERNEHCTELPKVESKKFEHVLRSALVNCWALLQLVGW